MQPVLGEAQANEPQLSTLFSFQILPGSRQYLCSNGRNIILFSSGCFAESVAHYTAQLLVCIFSSYRVSCILAPLIQPCIPPSRQSGMWALSSLPSGAQSTEGCCCPAFPAQTPASHYHGQEQGSGAVLLPLTLHIIKFLKSGWNPPFLEWEQPFFGHGRSQKHRQGWGQLPLFL